MSITDLTYNSSKAIKLFMKLSPLRKRASVTATNFIFAQVRN